MTLTVELESRPNPEVCICFDDEGLELLIHRLQEIRGKKAHDHLMTPSWAGTELTEIKQGGAAFELIHHLRLVNCGETSERDSIS